MSRLLATNSDFRDAVGLQLDELRPAALFEVEALRRFGDIAEQTATAFSLFEKVYTILDDRDKAAVIPPPLFKSNFSVLACQLERA